MIELITWKESFSLGIKEIDTQHKRMIGIINKLYDAMETSTEKEKLSDILRELNEYANYHFETEEKYFHEFNYEHAIEHIKSHDMYREKVNQFSKDYNNYSEHLVLPFEMMEFLRGWWTRHILGEDRLYVKNFHEHNLK